MQHWPFAVIDKEGSPLIKVQYLGEDKTFSPQEISSMVLSKMKEISEAKLGKTVKKAVVTCVFFLSFFTPTSKLSGNIAYLPTSTTLNVSLPRMLVPSLV
jgi:heat shock protein 1/8